LTVAGVTAAVAADEGVLAAARAGTATPVDAAGRLWR
jgi:hypothetical protein